ncbi:Ku protein [Streptomyces lunalinharesii]|uniref:Non-homologous end joining protein Ku n=1 Tax=Streptomyces lunalinharesii TaxID=333384 RepID=A0ABN3R521_9ACTN
MRAIWNGSISFGLVTIPVKTYSATDRTSSVSFVRLHEKDGAPIQYRKICELDGREVPNEDVGKGYQPPGDDAVVPITDEDLSRLPMPTAKTLSILSFVDPAEIDPLQLDKAYYLGPNGTAATKPYALLREALEHHAKVAIGKVAMRGRETLAMLRAHDGALLMHTLLWPDQIRSADGVAPEAVTVRENEMKLAETLMDALGELDPAELHDDYREAVEELVAAKREGGAPQVPDASAAPGARVIDLTAALERSVRAVRGGDREGAGNASVTPLRGRGPTRKKAAAKTAARAKGDSERTGRTSAAKQAAGGAGGAGRRTTGKAAAEKTAAGRSTTGKTAAGKTAAKKPSRAKRTTKSSAS